MNIFNNSFLSTAWDMLGGAISGTETRTSVYGEMQTNFDLSLNNDIPSCNPANGLPMLNDDSGIDIAGNAFGSDFSIFD
jgi:hypothetical protein